MRPAPDPRLVAALRPWLGRLDPPPGADGDGRCVVACSGGADSLALLALTVGAGLDVVAVHVDHGLRAGGAAEAAVVRSAAARFGVDHEAVRVEVAGGANLEARCREARYAALDESRRRLGADLVLLGHTADDQAETVLLNLLRGAGLPGLAGMPRARDRIARPVLGLRRADTTEICARLGLAPLHDPTNDDLSFRRNWIRREVLPLLEAGTGRDLRPVLARQADLLRGDAELLDGLADAELAVLERGGALGCEVTERSGALARRVVRRWLERRTGPPPTARDVAAVIDVGLGTAPAADLGGGWRVERTAGRLHLVEPGEATSVAWSEETVPVPGTAAVAGLTISSWIERAHPTAWPDGRWTCVLDADVVGEALVVRPHRPGERFSPLGLGGSKRMTELLAEVGVPPSSRRRHPVVADPAGTPVWVLGYGVGAPARVTSITRRYLWLRAEPEPAMVRSSMGEGPHS